MKTGHREVMQMALDALNVATTPFAKDRQEVLAAIEALSAALAQPDVPESCFGETKPVAMKFQIYKQTPPRGRELEPINSALLPWVYDQDPSSGNTASMWVTPVATLPLQRKPLSDSEIDFIVSQDQWTCDVEGTNWKAAFIRITRAIEAAHGIGGDHA